MVVLHRAKWQGSGQYEMQTQGEEENKILLMGKMVSVARNTWGQVQGHMVMGRSGEVGQFLFVFHKYCECLISCSKID